MAGPRIEVIPVTQFIQNCMLVYPEGGGRAVLIDPGGEWDRIETAARTSGAQIEAILVTHGHIDHIGALPQAVAATGVRTWLHPEDVWLFEDPGMGMWNRPAIPVPDDHAFIADGDRIEAAGYSFEVLHSPGHSPGHVCFLLRTDDRILVFGGDLVFDGSIGRTDFPGGDLPTLVRSVHEKLWTLPDDTTILPGHGPATTVGREKATNPFVGLHVIGDLR